MNSRLKREDQTLLTTEKIQSMQACHVNRISINPQTMDDTILRRIGRGHSAQDIDDMYQYVKKTYRFLLLIWIL